MEKESKRKGRERHCDQAAGRRKKLKENEPAEESVATEEEVEEFFAILRRMKAAVKYFEKGSTSKNKNGEGWRAVEAEVAAAVAVVGGGLEEDQEMKVEEIDLNAVPAGDVGEES